MNELQEVRAFNSHLPSKVLYIDSRDASQYLQTGYTSYFKYTLTEKIEVPENQVVFISLNSATIPYSFYNIREGVNDTIKATITNNTTGVGRDAIFTVPSGNYSALSLANHIEENFNQSTDANGVADGFYLFTLTINFNNDKGKYEFEIAGRDKDAGVSFTFIMGFDSSMRIELGIASNQNLVITSGGSSTESIDFVDINGSIHGVYIRTNLTTNSTLDSQNGTFSNILARIPIKVQAGGIIFREPNMSGHKALTHLKTISQISIRLTDERNRLLDLNGLHFQLAVKFDFDYLQNVIPPMSARERRLAQGYMVDGVAGNLSAQKIQEAQQKKLMDELNLKKKDKRGRPRKVGRPKGTKIKNSE